MKKIFSYILSALFALSLSGCEKYLEVDPTNVRAVKTYDDVKSMMGGYLRMFTAVSSDALVGTTIPWQQAHTYLMFNFYADDLDTDRFIASDYATSRMYLDVYVGSLNWQNPSMPGTIWNDLYLNIGFFNSVIDGVAGVAATQAERDIVAMEARFLRAWYLFKAMQYFSPYKNDALGLPFNFDSRATTTYDGVRHTQTECYAAIISELEEVLACTTPPRATYNIFYDKDMVNALLAQVYHFKGGSGAAAADDYTEAIAHAKAVLDRRPILSLADYTPFPDFANTLGILTGRSKQPALVSASSFLQAGMYSIGPWDPQYPTDDLWALYADNDIRRGKFFSSSRAITKFNHANPSWATANPYQADYRMTFNFFHTADMHLIVAESYAHQNDGNARTWLESFRRERYNNYAPYTGSDILAEILRERRREFCLEYDMRWLDLVRYPKGWTRKSYNDSKNPTYTITADDYRFCLPIPLEQELQTNNIEQNPGWGMF